MSISSLSKPTTSTSTDTALSTLTTSIISNVLDSIAYTMSISTPTSTSASNATLQTQIHLSGLKHWPSGLAVSPLTLMYIVAACVCFTIMLSLCFCTDNVGRYIKAKNNTGGMTVQAAPIWPVRIGGGDGANDERRHERRRSRGRSSVRASSRPPKKRSNSTDSPSRRHPFVPYTTTRSDIRRNAYAFEELEMRDLPRISSVPGIPNRARYFPPPYIPQIPQCRISDEKIGLRGGSGHPSGTQRVPNWLSPKSMFVRKRRDTIPTPRLNISCPIPGGPTSHGNQYASLHNRDFSSQSVVISPPTNIPLSRNMSKKREFRQTDTSNTATEFSFQPSSGSDTDIAKYNTISRLKNKFKPLLHKISRRSMRESFIQPHTSDGESVSATQENPVKRALRRARSSGSIPFNIFKLPEAAIPPEEQMYRERPTSIFSSEEERMSFETGTASSSLRSPPIKKMLDKKGKSRREILKRTDSMRGVVCRQDCERRNERVCEVDIDIAAAKAFERLRGCGGKRGGCGSASARGSANDGMRDVSETGTVVSKGRVGEEVSERASASVSVSVKEASEDENEGVNEDKRNSEEGDGAETENIESMRSASISRVRQLDGTNAILDKRIARAQSYASSVAKQEQHSRHWAARTRVGSWSWAQGGVDGMEGVEEREERKRGRLALLMVRGVDEDVGERGEKLRVGMEMEMGTRVGIVRMDFRGGGGAYEDEEGEGEESEVS